MVCRQSYSTLHGFGWQAEFLYYKELLYLEMPSIIEGYEYDIFINYRQNDNKYDGWVTEFVDKIDWLK